MNCLGFPNRWVCELSCVLAKEAGMHGQSLSLDLRRRVVDAIEQGLSCRRAAERFGVSASSIPAGGDRSVNAVWTYETPF